VSLCAQKVVEISFEDFDNVECKLSGTTKLDDIQGVCIEKKVLRMENSKEKGELFSIELGREFALKGQNDIQKQTRRIRSLKNKAQEKLEFASLLENLGMMFRRNFEKEKLCRILNKKTQFYFGSSKRMIFYCVTSVLFAPVSLTSLEQINVKYAKEIRLSFANEMMTRLLFKKHIYGFLNRVELKFLKELICFQKNCS